MQRVLVVCNLYKVIVLSLFLNKQQSFLLARINHNFHADSSVTWTLNVIT